MKKFLALALALMMVFALAACGGKTDPAPSGNDDPGTSQQTEPGVSQQTPSETDSGDKKEALVSKVGDTARYGSFEGMEIEWRTLAVDTEAKKALLIATDIAAYWAFNDVPAEVTWETCTLREWLNNEFYNAAFSDEQKAIILNSTLSNPANPEFGAGAGADTTDKVFLLSFEEAQQYFSDDDDRLAEVNFTDEYVANLSKLIAAHTAFGYTEDEIKNELKDYVGTTDKWALRTSGETLNQAADVSYDGSMYAHGSNVEKVVIGVRPAIWVDISDGE